MIPISRATTVPVDRELPAPAAAPFEEAAPTDITAMEPQHSWMSAETVLLTPNTPNSMRPGSRRDPPMHAVSTDVSDQSIAIGSINDSAGVPATSCPGSQTTFPLTQIAETVTRIREERGPPPTLQDPHMSLDTAPAMATRNRCSPTDDGVTRNVDVEKSLMKFPPRASNDAIAVNKLCYLLHPDCGDDVVAEGRTGGSWKAKAQKFGRLCAVGEQMVQIHRVLVPNLRLLHLEERQPFETLEDAVVKPTGSNVYVKWDTKYVHKRAA